MKTVVVFLFILVLQVLCVPPKCKEVNVDTEEVWGHCCLFVKNESEDNAKEKVIQQFLDRINKASSNSHKRVSAVHRILYPDDMVRQREPNEGTSLNRKPNNYPGDVVTKKTVDESSTSKNISLGTRVNVDVPDTCTRGKKKDINGKCVEVFDDIE